MDNLFGEIFKTYGWIGAFAYLLVTIHGKVYWKKMRGTYIGYSDINERLNRFEIRIRKVESEVVIQAQETKNHSLRDEAQFNAIKEKLNENKESFNIFANRIHSYTELVRTELSSMRKRVDDIWSFLGKGK